MNFKFDLFQFTVVGFILVFSCDTADESIVIVPDGYVGSILIVYDQKYGLEERYQDNKRVYVVPEDGILMSKFSDNDGIARVPEFYYSGIEAKNRIDFVAEASSLPMDQVVAHGGVVGSYKEIKFIQYFIGDSLKIFDSYNNDLIDLVIEKMN